ncbi:unnamed protein product [Sphagnum jensenii]
MQALKEGVQEDGGLEPQARWSVTRDYTLIYESTGERSFKASHKIKWSPEQELKTSKDNVHKSKKPEVEE